jgi:hypothetical protein
VDGKAFVDLDWVERQASMLRRDLELSELDILDPYDLAEKMEFIEVVQPDEVRDIPSECLQQLCERDPKSWSAGSVELPDGTVRVIMNPKHAKTRARVTLMEEIAHIHLAHQPSRLSIGADNVIVRSYNEQQEREAYWVGAAALVPMWQLKQAQKLGIGIQQLAAYCEVSPKLIEFRANITHISLVQSMVKSNSQKKPKKRFYSYGMDNW